MKYFIFLYYLASYTTGFAGITLLILFYLKYRMKSILYFIIFLAADTGILIFVNTEFYRITILFKYDTYNNFWTILIHNILFSMTFFFLPLAIHNFFSLSFKAYHKIIFGILCLLPVLSGIPPYLYSGLRQGEAIVFNFKAIDWVSLAVFIYAVVLLSLQRGSTGIKEKRTIINFFIVLYSFSILALVFEYFWNFNFQNFLRPLTFSSLLYFIQNLVTIIFLSKHFFFMAQHSPGYEIPENIILEYGITPREKEIIKMISRGYTNKMMAQELGIATLTVKNHIYNIYQKTRALSKIDLINKVSNGGFSIESKIASIFS